MVYLDLSIICYYIMSMKFNIRSIYRQVCKIVEDVFMIARRLHFSAVAENLDNTRITRQLIMVSSYFTVSDFIDNFIIETPGISTLFCYVPFPGHSGQRRRIHMKCELGTSIVAMPIFPSKLIVQLAA